jgi:hypothetical protein
VTFASPFVFLSIVVLMMTSLLGCASTQPSSVTTIIVFVPATPAILTDSEIAELEAGFKAELVRKARFAGQGRSYDLDQTVVKVNAEEPLKGSVSAFGGFRYVATAVVPSRVEGDYAVVTAVRCRGNQKWFLDTISRVQKGKGYLVTHGSVP